MDYDNFRDTGAAVAQRSRLAMQFICLDVTDSSFVLDFVSLEQPLIADIAVPPGTPFSLLIQHGDAEPAGVDVATIRRWASDADIVTMTGSNSSTSSLLCLSAEGCCLVLEISSD